MNFTTRAIAAVAMLHAATGASAQSFDPRDAATFSPASVTERGVAVRASVRIALGRNADGRGHDWQPLRFDVGAGPHWRVSDGRPLDNGRLLSADALRVSFAPRHSLRLSLNGQPVATRFDNARLAAAEGEGGGRVSPWLIVGGVVVVGLGVAYFALEDAIDCTEDGEYVCE